MFYLFIHTDSFCILYCAHEISITSLCIGGLGVGGDKVTLGSFCLPPPWELTAVDTAVVYTCDQGYLDVSAGDGRLVCA